MADPSLNSLRQEEDSTLLSYTLHGRAMLAFRSSVAVLRPLHPFVNLTIDEKLFGSTFRGRETDFKLGNPLAND